MLKVRTMLAWMRQYVRKAPIGEMSAQEVYSRIGTGELVLLDANLWGQWVRGHIPGARYVGMEGVTPEALPADRDKLLVFYCESSL